jgi:hypothetical protein
MKGDHCNCIALNHAHESGQCDEPEPPTGKGICMTCRYYEPPTHAELVDAVNNSDMPNDVRWMLRRILMAQEN